MEKTEVEQTIAELQKTAEDAVIYKAIGSLLVKAERPKVTEELVERKELLEHAPQCWHDKKNAYAAKLKNPKRSCKKTSTPSPVNPYPKRVDAWMVELGFRELTTEQTELLCQTAETTAHKSISSKISSKHIERLDICVEVEGTKPVDVTVEIDLVYPRS